MTSVVNMAGGQFVSWTSGSGEWKATIGTSASASIFSCGGRSWNVAPTTSSATLLQVEIPAPTTTDLEGVTGSANDVACPTGEISYQLRDWTDT